MSTLDLHGSRRLCYIIQALCVIALIMMNYQISLSSLSFQQIFYLELFSVLAVITVLIPWPTFQVRFLLSTFCMMVAWRLVALAHLPLVIYIYLAVLILKLLNYAIAAYNDIKAAAIEGKHVHHSTKFEWQLFFIRMFIGFDLVPHFCEKLFAGGVIRAEDIQAFTALHVPQPMWFVLIAGVCEFGAALSLSTGFLTRLGSGCFFIYLMVATYLGGHFGLGFIWASAGGGWEFPVLWAVLSLSFIFFGAGAFSLDDAIAEKTNSPRWLLLIMGGQQLKL